MTFWLMACFLFLQAETNIAQDCPVGAAWTLVSGQCLMCHTGLRNFLDGKEICTSKAATVGPIRTKAQHDFAEGCSPESAAILEDDGPYTGLRARRNSAGGVERYWDDGSPYLGPPPGVTIDDDGDTVGCYAITEPSKWVLYDNDYDCSYRRYFYCIRDPVSCQPLQAPTGSAVTYNRSTTPIQPDTVATYSCTEGYVLDGANAGRVCLSNGSWNGEDPVCIRSSNGLATYVTTIVNSVATYSCNAGYSLGDVSPSRTCQADGTWSGTALTCSSSGSNVLAIAFGAAAGGLALLGIVACLLFQCTRAPLSPPAAPPRPVPNPRPMFNLRRIAGPSRPPMRAQRFPYY